MDKASKISKMNVSLGCCVAQLSTWDGTEPARPALRPCYGCALLKLGQTKFPDPPTILQFPKHLGLSVSRGCVALRSPPQVASRSRMSGLKGGRDPDSTGERWRVLSANLIWAARQHPQLWKLNKTHLSRN